MAKHFLEDFDLFYCLNKTKLTRTLTIRGLEVPYVLRFQNNFCKKARVIH